MIGIILLAFMFGASSLFCLIIVFSAGSVMPIIGTAIVILSVFIIFAILSVKEISGNQMIVALVATVVVCGTAQFIINSQVEMPSYWKGKDEIPLRIMSAYVSQFSTCYLAYKLSEVFADSFDRKTNQLVDRIKSYLKIQIHELRHIESLLSDSFNSYKNNDRFILLLSELTDEPIEKTYIASRAKNDRKLLQEIDDISQKNNLGIDTNNKMLLSINEDVQLSIKHKWKLYNDFIQTNYSRKDYSLLKKMIKTFSSPPKNEQRVS